MYRCVGAARSDVPGRFTGAGRMDSRPDLDAYMPKTIHCHADRSEGAELEAVNAALIEAL